jgi:hypothetical protein
MLCRCYFVAWRRRRAREHRPYTAGPSTWRAHAPTAPAGSRGAGAPPKRQRGERAFTSNTTEGALAPQWRGGCSGSMPAPSGRNMPRCPGLITLIPLGCLRPLPQPLVWWPAAGCAAAAAKAAAAALLLLLLLLAVLRLASVVIALLPRRPSRIGRVGGRLLLRRLRRRLLWRADADGCHERFERLRRADEPPVVRGARRRERGLPGRERHVERSEERAPWREGSPRAARAARAAAPRSGRLGESERRGGRVRPHLPPGDWG